jgi:hypothetical protein
VQNPSQINRNNLNNIRPEASRHFINKTSESKIEELATNSKNGNIRDTYKGVEELPTGD